MHRSPSTNGVSSLTSGIKITTFADMSSSPRYSVVVPVYNRPQELDELLHSLTEQTFRDFEVIIVEDGSSITSQSVYEKYASQLSISYFVKPNSGPGPSRNYGFEKARGDYFVVFDSDCVIPPQYFEVVENYLRSQPLDAWGGPDRGHNDFTLLQRAMAFTMSSVVTTGGIRGGKQHLGNFQPRSFNMGLSRQVFEKTGGFQFSRFAEDIELSIRMRKAGFRVGLIADGYVFHKRRTSLGQFFKQVSNFGKGRILVGQAHPGEVKLAHWAPAVFLAGLVTTVLMFLFYAPLAAFMSAAYLFFFLVLFVDGIRVTGSFAVSLLALPSAFVQLTGYGFGFLKEKLKTYI